jgi:hypothetical protein
MKKAPLVIFCQFCALSFAQTQSITIPAGTEISIRTHERHQLEEGRYHHGVSGEHG